VAGASYRDGLKEESVDLEAMLSTGDGRAWFDTFDIDGNGNLEKVEIIRALLQTCKMPRDTTIAIVEAVWKMIDTDDSGSIDFGEFQPLREAIVQQFAHDRRGRAQAS
jgi:Ca2+-binding EF-hand superfamily protein